MKKIFKNSTFLSMGIGVVLALISLITFIFIKNRVYFNIVYILNIVINFAVIIFNIATNEKNTIKFNSLTQSGYILVTLAILYIDLLVVSFVWDMNIYSNLMHVTNTSMYLIIYSILMLMILLMNLYNVITNDKNIQNSTKVIENSKK